MTLLRHTLVAITLSLLAQPTWAQITVLDNAQDNVAAPAAPRPPCGTEPVSIARMSWPSAAILAEIHARLLAAEFGCEVEVVPGDLAATASSMGSTGQPQVAPELWVNRIADLWNGAMEGQQVRSAAPSYAETQFEGWYMPSTLASSFTAQPKAADLAVALPQVHTEGRMRFISCPLDWACSVINRNLIAAHGLADLVEIVEPANRLEMDRLIAEGLNRREPFLFYYWRPNAILAQLDFVAVDMGEFVEDAAQCLADLVCAVPQPSAFPPDMVVIALAERLFTETPQVAGYFQRASMPLEEMDQMLAHLNEPGATEETVADRFVAERADLWQAWIGATP
jgi:glycine betaine/proline transport system substrate-binding protein